MQPISIPFINHGGNIETIFLGYQGYHVDDKDTWNSRAWTLEEQLLSSRLLLCSNNGLLWQCKETLGTDEVATGTSKVFIGLPWSRNETRINKEDGGVVDTRVIWADILCNYTQRRVTHAKDKLVALAAVAEEFARVWQGKDVYLAGLWQPRLFVELLWHRDNTSHYKWYLKLAPRSHQYRAGAGAGLQLMAMSSVAIVNFYENLTIFRFSAARQH